MNNLKIILPAFLVPIIFFSMQGTIGLDLWDEGFFWYGAQRITFGEVPILDYMAYDIGRYYWSGAFLWLLGDLGIISLRFSVLVLQIAAVLITMLVIKNKGKPTSFTFNFTIAVIIVFWMYPYFKSFDHLAALLIIGGLTLVLTEQSKCRFLICGIALGLVALLGRNHGVYGLVAVCISLIYMAYVLRNWKKIAKYLPFICIGVLIGYLPMILMLLFVDGFAEAYWVHAIKFLFENKATNLPLAVPWLWRVSVVSMPWQPLIQAIGIGIWLIILPGLLLLGIIGVLFAKKFNIFREPVIVAGLFVTLPYMHYVFSRPDLVHLSASLMPLIIVLIALAARLKKVISAIIISSLFILTTIVLLPVQGRYVTFMNDGWKETKVGKDKLWLDSGTISQIQMVSDLVTSFAPNGRDFLAVPFLPGVYPVFERKAPIWEIYALFPRSEEFQKEEINRIIKNQPGFAVVWDFPLDGRDDLRYKNTHPLIQKYIEENFDSYINSRASKEFELFKSRDNLINKQ